MTEQVLVVGKSSEWKRVKAWLSQTTMVRPVKGFLNDKGEVTAAAAAGAGAGAGGNAKLSAETAESLKAKGGAKTTALVAANVNGDDDVMCLVEIPARFETVSKSVLKTAATTREVDVPAEFATVTRQVVDTAASFQRLIRQCHVK